MNLDELLALPADEFYGLVHTGRVDVDAGMNEAALARLNSWDTDPGQMHKLMMLTRDRPRAAPLAAYSFESSQSPGRFEWDYFLWSYYVTRNEELAPPEFFQNPAHMLREQILCDFVETQLELTNLPAYLNLFNVFGMAPITFARSHRMSDGVRLDVRGRATRLRVQHTDTHSVDYNALHEHVFECPEDAAHYIRYLKRGKYFKLKSWDSVIRKLDFALEVRDMVYYVLTLRFASLVYKLPDDAVDLLKRTVHLPNNVLHVRLHVHLVRANKTLRDAPWLPPDHRALHATLAAYRFNTNHIKFDLPPEPLTEAGKLRRDVFALLTSTEPHKHVRPGLSYDFLFNYSKSILLGAYTNCPEPDRAFAFVHKFVMALEPRDRTTVAETWLDTYMYTDRPQDTRIIVFMMAIALPDANVCNLKQPNRFTDACYGVHMMTRFLLWRVSERCAVSFMRMV